MHFLYSSLEGIVLHSLADSLFQLKNCTWYSTLFVEALWLRFFSLQELILCKRLALHTSPHRGLCNYKTPITQYLGAWRFQCYRVNTRLAFNIRMKNALWETKNKKLNVTESECLPWKDSLSAASCLALSVDWCAAKSEREALEKD